MDCSYLGILVSHCWFRCELRKSRLTWYCISKLSGSGYRETESCSIGGIGVWNSNPQTSGCILVLLHLLKKKWKQSWTCYILSNIVNLAAKIYEVNLVSWYCDVIKLEKLLYPLSTRFFCLLNCNSGGLRNWKMTTFGGHKCLKPSSQPWKKWPAVGWLI